MELSDSSNSIPNPDLTTRMTQYTGKHTWAIENFAFYLENQSVPKTVNSPEFSILEHGLKLSIGLYLNGNGSSYKKEFTTASMNFSSLLSEVRPDGSGLKSVWKAGSVIAIEYLISVLNETGDQIVNFQDKFTQQIEPLKEPSKNGFKFIPKIVKFCPTYLPVTSKGQLLLECTFTISYPTDSFEGIIKLPPPVTATLGIKSTQEKKHSEKMKSLLEEGINSDVTLLVDGQTFKTHKMLLSLFSPVFKDMFSGNDTGNEVVITKVSARVIKSFLNFIYTGDVKDKNELTIELLHAAKVYKMDILSDYCQVQIHPHLHSNFVCPMLRYADGHKMKTLVNSCIDFIAHNFYNVISHSEEWQKFKKCARPELLHIIFIQLAKLKRNNSEVDDVCNE